MNKQKCYAWTMSLAALVVATACHEDIGFDSANGSGYIVPLVQLDKSVSSSKAASRAGEDDGDATSKQLTAQDLTLTLTRQTSTTAAASVKAQTKATASSTNQSYTFSLTDFPSDQKFPIGTYLVEAFHGTAGAEGLDCPYYYGSNTITVKDNETTQVNVTATLAQSMITVKYSDAFKNYMKAWSAEVTSQTSTQVFYENEERTPESDTDYKPVYVVPGTDIVSLTFTKANGGKKTLKLQEFEGLAQNHYTLTVDIEEGAADAVLSVKYEDALTEKTVEIDLSDELMSAPAPTITGNGVNNNQVFTIYESEGQALPQGVKANIIAKGGLSQVILVTESEDLLAQGWPSRIDLMAATADQQALLKSFGLNVTGLWKNPDKMAVVDFTNVLANTQKAAFTLKAIDKNGLTSDDFQFSYTFIESKVEIVSIDPLFNGSTTVTMMVSYPGSETLTFYYLGGRYNSTTPQKVSDEKLKIEDTTEKGIRKVTITVNEKDDNLTYYVTAGEKVSERVTLTRSDAPVTVSYDEADIWARKASFSGTIVDSSVGSGVQLAYREKGAATWHALETAQSGTTLTASTADNALTPGTTYELVAMQGALIKSAEKDFTTEAATQLPNAGMESWYTEQPYSKYQLLYYAGSSSSDCAWGTMNNLTTSTGGSGNSWTSYGGASYRATSGTKSTNDCKSGSLAAVIRTVGWGSSNTAAGTTAGKCSNITAGELYLGSYNSSTKSGNYGYTFTSRPVSLSFYYKYTTVTSGNGDFGVAEIKIKDASGSVIASKSMNVPEASTYTLATLALDYPDNAAKCASIEVNFKSSGSSVGTTYSSTYISVPDFANYTDGEYVGSQLYIDDIELNY